MFDFMKIEKTVSDVQQSLSAIQEIQAEILEEIGNVKEILSMIKKHIIPIEPIPYQEP